MRSSSEDRRIDVNSEGKIVTPDKPTIPFIEGDGVGQDIWKAAVRVFDAAVEKAYQGQKEVVWLELLAGQKAFDALGDWLPSETVESIKLHRVGPSRVS